MADEARRLRAHRALAVLEPVFGDTFLYRLPDGRTIVSGLRDIARVEADRPDPLGQIDSYLRGWEASSRPDPGGRRQGDLVFAFAHDLQWALRDASLPPAPAAAAPRDCLALLATVDTVVTFDALGVGIDAIGPLAGAAMDALRSADLTLPDELCALVPGTAGAVLPLTTVVRDLDPCAYAGRVGRLRSLMEAGDVYQVVLSDSVLVQPLHDLHDYFSVVSSRYRDAAFSYWLRAAGTHFFGNCSLPHVMVDGMRAWTSVFAGTGPSQATDPERDQTLERLAQEKYFSEHAMLVDLERNDLGTVSVGDGVSVEGFMTPVDVGPTTYLGSRVVARLPESWSLVEVLLGNFPRGVVVGAPKSRAQEVLADVECRPRGFYSGAIGLVHHADRTVVSNTIVTCGVVDGGTLRIDVAGGLLHASSVEQELSELRLKLAYTI